MQLHSYPGQNSRRESQEDNNHQQQTNMKKEILGTGWLKKEFGANRWKYVEDPGTTITEKAVREGNMTGIYFTTKKLSGKYCK